MKKYVLMKVISQMTTRSMRPIQHDPPSWILGLPHGGPARFPRARRSGGWKRGEYITGFSERKRVLASIIFRRRASFQKSAPNLFPAPSQRRIDEIFCFE